MTAALAQNDRSFGAVLLADGRTRFRLWAPDTLEPPRLVVDGQGERAMERESDGWYAVTTLAPAGTRYRYRVAPDLQVADPASRLQPEGVHGWSEVVDPQSYRWRHDGWRGRPWHESIIYELHVGAYGGGFLGVMRDLPRLAALGVTAVELMPIAAFPGSRNWGYDGVLPFAPDASYGSPDDLRQLIDAAHGLGLTVFLDVVYNHFGPDGNYLSAYAARFFAKDRTTPWGAAIDFSQRNVREFFIENALYWLDEYRFDGLRLDAAQAIEAAPGEGFLDELGDRVRARFAGVREVFLVLEHDDNAACHLGKGRYDAQWNDDAHHALHVLLTGQDDGYYADYADDPATRLARCLGEGFAYQGERSRHRGDAARGQPSAHLAPQSFVTFVQNHDQVGNRAFGERLTMLADPRALRAASALVLLCPQIPLLFMGEEWGSTRPFLYFTDHHGQLADAVREGRRREFARFVGFENAAQRTAIPDPNAPETFARSSIDWTERLGQGHLESEALCRALLTLRQRWLCPRLPGSRAIGAQAIGAKAVRAAWRLNDGITLSAYCNLAPTGVGVDSPPHGEILFATSAEASTQVVRGELPGRSTVWTAERAADGR